MSTQSQLLAILRALFLLALAVACNTIAIVILAVRS